MPKMKYFDETSEQWIELDSKNADAIKDENGTVTASDFLSHQADDVRHIIAEERTSWNGKETPDGARKKVEQTDFKVNKSGKDSNGVFTIVEYKRADNTLAIKSVLSGGVSPKYTTRSITYYDLDGVTLQKTTTFTLSYDTDGDLISEV